MPELPEVETVRAQLAERVSGRRFAAAAVIDDKFCSPMAPAEFVAGVVGRRVDRVGRRGKYLLFALDRGDDLVLHLRMTGRLHWSQGPPPEPEPFLRATLTLDDGGLLSFGDMRRFGRAWFAPAGERGERYWEAKVGVEPLGDGFSAERLAGLLAGRRGPIKALLLNQALVAGIGNIYADEALFEAAIHPERPGGSLDADEIARLQRAIVDRLQVAVRAGGASIDSYRDSLGRYGTMQDLLRVHLHRGDPCPRCGDTVVKIRVAQRGTYLCPTCQVAR